MRAMPQCRLLRSAAGKPAIFAWYMFIGLVMTSFLAHTLPAGEEREENAAPLLVFVREGSAVARTAVGRRIRIRDRFYLYPGDSLECSPECTTVLIDTGEKAHRLHRGESISWRELTSRRAVPAHGTDSFSIFPALLEGRARLMLQSGGLEEGFIGFDGRRTISEEASVEVLRGGRLKLTASDGRTALICGPGGKFEVSPTGFRLHEGEFLIQPPPHPRGRTCEGFKLHAWNVELSPACNALVTKVDRERAEVLVAPIDGTCRGRVVSGKGELIAVFEAGPSVPVIIKGILDETGEILEDCYVERSPAAGIVKRRMKEKLSSLFRVPASSDECRPTGSDRETEDEALLQLRRDQVRTCSEKRKRGRRWTPGMLRARRKALESPFVDRTILRLERLAGGETDHSRTAVELRTDSLFEENMGMRERMKRERLEGLDPGKNERERFFDQDISIHARWRYRRYLQRRALVIQRIDTLNSQILFYRTTSPPGADEIIRRLREERAALLRTLDQMKASQEYINRMY